MRDLLEQIRLTTDRDLDFNHASSEPNGGPPVDSPSDTSPGGENPSGLGGGSNSHNSAGCGSRGGAASRGGGGGSTSQRPTTRSQRMHPMQEI